MSSRYFSHAFWACSNSWGSIPLSPPTLNVCGPPPGFGSGKSIPCSRMHSANFTCASRSFSSSAAVGSPVVASLSSSPPQATRPSAAMASSAAAMGRTDIGLLSGRVAAKWSRTGLRAV